MSEYWINHRPVRYQPLNRRNYPHPAGVCYYCNGMIEHKSDVVIRRPRGAAWPQMYHTRCVPAASTDRFDG